MAKTSRSSGASDVNSGLTSVADDVVGLKNFKTPPLIGGEDLRDFVEGAEPSTMPATALVENMPRRLIASGTALTALTSGTLRLVHLSLLAGQVINGLAFATIGAVASPTNQWFGLFDVNRIALAFTADDLTAAWGGSTRKALNLTTPVVAPYTGLYYAGIMVAAATGPGLVGVIGSAVITTQAPSLGGNTSDTGLTSPPALPFTATAILTTTGQMPYVNAF